MPIRHHCILATLLLAVLAPASAQPQSAEAAKPVYRSAKEIIDAAPASAWRDIAPENTLYMELPAGRVVIELAPGFAPAHVANIKALAQGGFWNGLSIYRAQDNFVVQFGDPDADDASKRKPFPQGAKERLPAEFTRPSKDLQFDVLADADGWATQVGFADGFPAAREGTTGAAWLAHCYGAVGAGRNNEADSSTGAELYVVIGQAPRQLDRNITLVGRVVKGMEHLSAIARGPEPMGFYDTPQMRVPIKSVALASNVPEAERIPLQALRTDTPSFAAATEARRNRRDDFYKTPAGHIDLCNVPLPVRIKPGK